MSNYEVSTNIIKSLVSRYESQCTVTVLPRRERVFTEATEEAEQQNVIEDLSVSTRRLSVHSGISRT